MRSNINYLLAVAFVLMLGLSSCGDQNQFGRPLKQTHNLNGQVFPLEVMVFESEPELHRYLMKHKIEKKKVLGLARWTILKNDPSTVTDCTIYVVRPKGLDDSNRFETWGHELVHCVYGSFHEEAH